MTSPVKERLTGALILIIAVVVIVPELFSGRARKQLATDAPDAQSADAGPPLRSYTMDLGGDSRSQAQAQPQAPSAAPEAAPEAPVADTPSADVPAARVPPPPMPETATPDARVVAEKPSPVPAAAEPRPAANTRGWWVQLGSFSSRANAERLGETLSKAGYSMQVSSTTTKSKELFRVRAGPVADRDAAVSLQARLAAAGHKGSLVAP